MRPRRAGAPEQFGGQFHAAGLAQRRQHVVALLRQVPKEQGFLQAPLAERFRHVHRFAAERVAAGMPKAGGEAPRRGGEFLHLLDPQVVALEKQGHLDHVGEGAAGVAADEVGDHRLAAAELPAAAAEGGQEFREAGGARLAHDPGHRRADRLRGDLEPSAHVVGEQVGKVAGLAGEQVEAHPRGDEQVFHRRVGAQGTQQRHGLVLGGHQMGTDLGIQAARAATGHLRRRIAARQPVHVGRWPADVADRAAELGMRAQAVDLGAQRSHRAGLDGLPLVVGDGAEGAAAKAAAMGGQGELDLLVRRDRFRVGRMRAPAERQGVEPVELRLAQRQCRRVDNDDPVAVRLGERPGIGGVGLLGGEAKSRVVGGGIRGHFLVGRQGQGGRRRGGDQISRAADPVQAGDGLAAGQAPGHLEQGAFRHAVEEQVGLAVDQQRAAHPVVPVVVVRQTAQARLDAADHRRQPLEGPLDRGGVGDGGPVGAGAGHPPRGIGVVVAHLLRRGVAIDHGVHRPGGDGGEQARPAHDLQCCRVTPVGLGEDADPVAFGLQQAGQERHAEGRVVDVGVAADEQHVELRPAARRHLGPAGGEEGAARGGAARGHGRP